MSTALRRTLARLPALLGLALSFGAWATDWSASVDDRSGLPLVTRGGGTVVGASLNFWGAGWAWVYLAPRFQVNGPYSYTLKGSTQALDFDLTADIGKTDEHTLTWNIDLDAHKLHTGVIGGGLIFNFDPALFGEMGEPQLLPGNRGWSWGKDGQGRRIEMRFEPALASLYFERGNRSEVRTFFYKGSIRPGRQRYKAVLSLAGDVALGPTLAERFGLADPTQWPDDRVDWRTSPVDLSFLNAGETPAGKHGFLQADGEQLRFADGTPVRFWGTNLSAYTLFGTPDEEIRQQAKRLSALGFNLVRLHHHDSPWVLPNIFGDSRLIRDTQHLDPDSLKKLDWWIKCLKDEGIYVWLDMHVGRGVTANDGIYGFDELDKDEGGYAGLKGYAYVNITMQQAMKRFAEAYLTHVNAYTGLAYKDDPAIAAVLLTNENDITQHFGNALLPDKGVPKHNRLYMAEARAFASQHELPGDQTWRSWEPGPGKLFLNDLERRFDADMIQHLRGLGVKVPIVTTSTWGGNGLSALPALTSGDLIDVHSYGGPGQLEKNPLTSANLLDWIAAGQVAGKPLTVTEWNAEPFPTPDRHSLPLYIAGTASYQGWDALVQYAYSQESMTGQWVTADNWHAYNDPALLATFPAAALLYRRGDVRPAGTTYLFAPTPDTLFNKAITPDSSVLLRTAAEKGRLQIAMPQTPELPWLQPSPLAGDAQLLHDPDQSLLPADAGEATSDTGQLRRDWRQGLYTIDTPLTQAATGWLGGKSIGLADIQVQLATPYASVVVQSLDGAPFGQSKQLLISLGTRAVPRDGKSTPFHVEPIEGTLIIKAPPGLRLFSQGSHAPPKELPAPYHDGRYAIQLDGRQMSNWLFLK
ncbi:cellulase family glycosylhydrolase [Pseudomonas sp. NBRC 100443]|uniref:cellulase family glycosylhydrolase n=1 Tax=Pseudomonas sp. NBRC 100443 TaxID=1113665 RepID=UPI0024A0B8E9|nr:cellulase family glycosylhydrolase [Pseudomonas sp. NBRC 100443]GLU36639.1 hypothetical protein Pssp01_07320 [Pseudomonas sp. NBRC 100443]